MRFWMGVGQPVPWPSVPERDHLGMRLALLPFRRQLSRHGGVDGDPVECWSATRRSGVGAISSANSMPMASEDDVLEPVISGTLTKCFSRSTASLTISGEQSIRTVLCSIFWFNRSGIGLPQSACLAGFYGQLDANRASLLLTNC